MTTVAPDRAEATSDLAARYARAESMQAYAMKRLITSFNLVPGWIGTTDLFWYRNQTASGHEFVLVDPSARTRRRAFDHARLAAELAVVTEQDVDPQKLPFSAIEPRDGAVRFAVGPSQYEASLDDYAIKVLGPVRSGEALSPDGRWAVFQRDHDLDVRDTRTDAVRRLTTDGTAGHAYGGLTDPVSEIVKHENLGTSAPPQVVWSPDSSRFVTHRLDQREVGLMHLVRSAPLDGGRPRALSYHYSLPGDEHQATAELFVVDVATGSSVRARCEPIFMPFVPAIAYGWVWWSADQSKVYWLSNDRGDHHGALHQLDPGTGDVTVLVEESSESHILYGPQQQDRNVRTLSSGEVLWWSQRSGWGHLYLYGTDGRVTALTSGDWMVRHVVTVDEHARRVVFTAGGHDPDADPYLQQLCSVSLDGGEVTAITSDGLDHASTPSPSGDVFVDVASRWDVPPVSVLRDRSGAVVMELEEADASALYAAGWTPPERVVVKAADGVTDLRCAIYKPFDFDPEQSYPVVDEIYPGPQISTAPLRFPLSGGTMTGELHGATFAALGFVVVAVDGRGSALRSQAFQDHSRRSGDAVFVDDHAAAIAQLGQTRPWMDLDRVGIYGHSAGGYGSTRAMLQRPDFFKVAVSSSGNHDNRVNHAWWGEKFFGLVDDFDFERQSNTSLADRLEGKLLLIHGEMDDNAVPHGTMRLVDALIRANKDFDLLIVPNADHSLMHHRAYFVRRRWDFFVRHLLGETPPDHRLADVPFDPLA